MGSHAQSTLKSILWLEAKSHHGVAVISQVHECVRKSVLFHHGFTADAAADIADDSLPLIVLGLKETAPLNLKVQCSLPPTKLPPHAHLILSGHLM